MGARRGIHFFLLATVMLFSCMGHNMRPDVNAQSLENRFVFYECSAQQLIMKWKDAEGNILRSLGNFKSAVENEGRQLKFAMNGGMYLADQSPQGLYIENGQILKSLNTKTGSANFYWQPNGVLYVNGMNQAAVCKTENFLDPKGVKYATQSGPMLVIDGNIHPGFKEGSEYINIRNGVGILPSGNVIMAISTEEVTLYDFAKFFKDKGCQNALYLDGYISRAYGPSEGLDDEGGDFGVMIGVVE